eukprot:g5126.t1
MSKKVAQLTKVIYHLNTRNEDNEAELDHLTRQHESELEQILSDAARKLNHFKSLLEERKEQAATKEALDKLVKQHLMEKKAALTEFKEFKKKVRAKENANAKEAANALSALRRDVTEAKNRFKKQADDFFKVSAELTKSANAARKHANELKKKHKLETAALVREWNEKYNTMLSEQLDEKDKLVAQMGAKGGEELAAVEDRLRKEHAAELSRQTQSWSQQLAALTDQKEKAVAEICSQRDELMSNNNRMQSDLRILESTKSTLETKVSDLTSRLHTVETDNSKLKAELAAAQNAHRESVVGAASECEELRSLLDNSKAEIAKTKQELRKIKKDLAAAKLDCSRTSKALKDMESKFEESTKANATMRLEMEKLKSMLRREEEKVKKGKITNENTEKLLAKERKETKQLKSEIEKRRKMSSDLEKANQNALEKLQAE